MFVDVRYFYLDGRIQLEVKLTGILSMNVLSDGDNPTKPAFGTLVAPHLNAQYHQHVVSYSTLDVIHVCVLFSSQALGERRISFGGRKLWLG